MESKTGLDGGLAAEFFEQPVVIVGVDEGGDGGTEPLGPEPAGSPERSRMGRRVRRGFGRSGRG